MEELTEKKMAVLSILELVEEYRGKATWNCHEYSNARASETEPCTDNDVAIFLGLLNDGTEKATLVISNIDWEETGNCVGDDLFPVVLEAIKLPDGRYYLELFSRDDYLEFVYKVM